MTLAVSRAFMVGLDKHPEDTDSSQASCLASRFQEPMNVHRGTGVNITVTLHQSFLYLTCFTVLNNIILPNKVYTKRMFLNRERVEFISVPVCRRSSCPIRDLQRFRFIQDIFVLFKFSPVYKELKYLLFQRLVIGTSDQF